MSAAKHSFLVPHALPRREFLKAGGALVIGFSSAGAISDALFAQESAAARGATAGPPDPKQIDTWLAIHSDNTATVYIGYVELGQGSTTSLLQISAEELDLDMSQVGTVRLDTNITPNQGGTYSSSSIARGSPAIRTAAAEARQALLQMASKKLGAPVERLIVSKGVVTVGGMGGESASVTYGELIGDKQFNLAFTGSAPVKPVSDYKLVGTRPPRNDIPDKVSGKYVYLQHLRLPGMLHGRVVRPRGQTAYGSGAKVVTLDESSIAHIPSARVVRRGDFVGVVAEREWDAVRAARDLKITWDIPPALPTSESVYDAMRAETTRDRVVLQRGDVDAAVRDAAHIATGHYRGPYQAHAPFGPNGALADVKSDSALVICSTQDVYATRNALAGILGLKPQQVRVQYYEGSGTYGHSCYDDVAQAAAILSQLAGKPVRLQFMRWDEHGWDLYGPAHVGEVRAAADANGKIVAYQYDGWHHNWSAVETSAQLALGTTAAEWPDGAAQMVNPSDCGGMYDIANAKLVNHHVPGMNYLRAAWLRSPLDLSFSFASEQTIDELARQAGIDAYEFRKRNITSDRWMGVLDAVAKASKWDVTPLPPASKLSKEKIVTGRGIGLGTHLTSYGGAVAEIEVNKETGKVRVKRMYGAIDAGLAVNPAFIENQISGQLVQTASRMLLEEVKFNKTNVTSLDWNSYPILRFEECPEVVPIVVQRLDQKSTGAGEEVMAAAAGAIACAFFDATGVHITEFPLTPKRVLAALGSG
ncbi:MAG TPA: molybdopterin cofactor-binding domain-containing protein [Candidatus Acidoferrales bacterium]|nr:molybdopterin cofactor-binding domain-containing protein [Candidatus Acidoferrales bacterium]